MVFPVPTSPYKYRPRGFCPFSSGSGARANNRENCGGEFSPGLERTEVESYEGLGIGDDRQTGGWMVDEFVVQVLQNLDDLCLVVIRSECACLDHGMVLLER